MPKTPPRAPETAPRDRSRVSSATVGVDLLRALAAAEEPQTLSSLARAARMSAPKAHRYLASYVESGLVIQNERSGSYDLGPLAVQIGLAALRRYEALALAEARLHILRDAVDQTCLLAIWGQGGPTVSRIALSNHPVTLAVRTGTTFPLLTTATGRIFLAYHPPREIEPLLTRELADRPRIAGAPRTRAEAAALTDEVRRRGLARVAATFLVGVDAISGPVFAPDGRLAAVLTVIGRSGSIDLRWTGRLARAVKEFAAGAATIPRRP